MYNFKKGDLVQHVPSGCVGVYGNHDGMKIYVDVYDFGQMDKSSMVWWERTDCQPAPDYAPLVEAVGELGEMTKDRHGVGFWPGMYDFPCTFMRKLKVAYTACTHTHSAETINGRSDDEKDGYKIVTNNGVTVEGCGDVEITCPGKAGGGSILPNAPYTLDGGHVYKWLAKDRTGAFVCTKKPKFVDEWCHWGSRTYIGDCPSFLRNDQLWYREVQTGKGLARTRGLKHTWRAYWWRLEADFGKKIPYTEERCENAASVEPDTNVFAAGGAVKQTVDAGLYEAAKNISGWVFDDHVQGGKFCASCNNSVADGHDSSCQYAILENALANSSPAEWITYRYPTEDDINDECEVYAQRLDGSGTLAHYHDVIKYWGHRYVSFLPLPTQYYPPKECGEWCEHYCPSVDIGMSHTNEVAMCFKARKINPTYGMPGCPHGGGDA